MEEGQASTGKLNSHAKDLNESKECCNAVQDSPSNGNVENSLIENTENSPKPSCSEKKSTWQKLTDVNGSYYWNIETGATQYEAPTDTDETNEMGEPLDSSLADLEGAAFRYASLHLSDDSSTDPDAQTSKSNANNDAGKIFFVQSLGWLPLNHFSTDPETSSSEVNACIQHLSSSHSKITDAVGAWGDGQDMILVIEDEYLRLLDPSTHVVLQSQSIKHIRVWGVGSNCPRDFAYVAKDSLTRQYKCHVFRCDVSAKAIAQELHTVCAKLSQKAINESNKNEIDKQEMAMSTSIPIPKLESTTEFQVKYLGMCQVENVNGIQTIKNVIREITTNEQALCIECIALVSASALVIRKKQNNDDIVNCRTRCLSFFGIGDDISLFAFINVVGNEAKCHVVQCLPNAAKFAHEVQEACMLRFQKAVDSRSTPESSPPASQNKKSFKSYFKSIFSRKSHS